MIIIIKSSLYSIKGVIINMKEKKYSCINGIKGLAAIEIACIYHLATINYPYKFGLPLKNSRLFSWCYSNGWILTELFILLSGFLAFYVYSEKIKNGMTFTQFIKKRALRIFPLMWITLGTTVVLDLIYGIFHGHMFFVNVPHDNLLTLLLSIFGMQSMFNIGQAWNYPAWTISQLLICWAIYYWIIKLGKNKTSFNVWACIIFIMIGISIQTSGNIGTILFNSYISRAYVAFFSGGVIYYLNEYIYNNRLQIKAVVISIIWLLIVIGLYKYGISFEWLSATYSLCIFPPILIVIFNIKILSKLFATKLLNWLGEISFSIYLCNFSLELLVVIMNEIFKLNINASTIEFFCINTILNILFATIIHYYAEKKLSLKLEKLLYSK